MVVPFARSSLAGPIAALLSILVTLGCLPLPAERMAASTAPQAARASPQITVVLDGDTLHPNVKSVTLRPSESMPLLDRVSHDSLPQGPGFALWLAEPAAPARWQADRGSISVERAGTPARTHYTAPATAGIDRLRIVDDGSPARPLAEIIVLTLIPFEVLRTERIDTYRIGRYPPPLADTAPQARARRSSIDGFVEVTHENRPTRLSSHVRLRDLECKQAHEGYPRYLALDVRILDKLERLTDLLQAEGIPGTALTIMSGYRTPYYNRRIGNRTAWSRHVMGDAADVFVDRDGDGNMDDLDGDGRVSLADAEVLLRFVDALDAESPMVGGASAYPATASHGPFVHLDARGYRARW